MPEGQVLEFSGVTKRFGTVTAVSDLTTRVEPGSVTGFLGPNGAGKTTTLRILLGLVRATEGSATIGGVAYAQLARPLQTVGAVLEAANYHPGRTAANHLNVYARAAGIPLPRVDEVLGLVGLADVAGRKVGGFSLGMRQRLGLAYALLGDPGVLVLDEPANGLDPEGIRWMRGLLRTLADEGRTVLVSSHQLAEMQQTVDALLIIANGRIVFQGGIEDLGDPAEDATIVDAPDRAALTAVLESAGLSFEVLRSGLTVRSAEPADIGALAAAAGIALSTLQRRGAGLEEVFLDLVNGERTQSSSGGAALATTALAANGEPEEDADAAEPDAAEPDAAAEPAAVAAPVADGDRDTTDDADTAADDSTPGDAGEVTDEAALAPGGAEAGTTDDDWIADRLPFEPDPDAETGPVVEAPEEPAEGEGDSTPEEQPAEGERDSSLEEQPAQPAPLTWQPEPASPPPAAEPVASGIDDEPAASGAAAEPVDGDEEERR